MADDPDFDMAVARQKLRENSKDTAESIMKLAGFEWTHAWELANRYWPDHPNYDGVRQPWWLFLTQFGPVEIGRRKRVFVISWAACAFKGIVTNDDVTKDVSVVHAWTVEKMVEYAGALRRAMAKEARQ